MSSETTTYRRLGDYIRQVDVRNRDLKVTRLVGVNLDKEFIPSVANTVGTDMATYKIVSYNQFGCKLMSVERDRKMPVSLMKDKEPVLISSAYYVFEVLDENILDPDFLFLQIKRPEFDRRLWFSSGGDVRGGVGFDNLEDMPISVPPIEEQREIVARHKAIEHKIDVNRRLIAKLEETARTIYRHTFVENIDPENLPQGWRVGKLSEIAEYSTDRVDCDELTTSNYISTENMLKDRAGVFQIDEVPTGRCIKFNSEDILISNIRPYFKKIWQADKTGGCSADVLCFRSKVVSSQFLYYVLESDAFFDYVVAGCNGAKMPRGDKKWIMDYSIVIPSEDVEDNFILQISILKKYSREIIKINNLLSAL